MKPKLPVICPSCESKLSVLLDEVAFWDLLAVGGFLVVFGRKYFIFDTTGSARKYEAYFTLLHVHA